MWKTCSFAWRASHIATLWTSRGLKKWASRIRYHRKVNHIYWKRRMWKSNIYLKVRMKFISRIWGNFSLRMIILSTITVISTNKLKSTKTKNSNKPYYLHKTTFWSLWTNSKNSLLKEVETTALPNINLRVQNSLSKVGDQKITQTLRGINPKK